MGVEDTMTSRSPISQKIYMQEEEEKNKKGGGGGGEGREEDWLHNGKMNSAKTSYSLTSLQSPTKITNMHKNIKQ